VLRMTTTATRAASMRPDDVQRRANPAIHVGSLACRWRAW
jgi:hypothetical protein